MFNKNFPTLFEKGEALKITPLLNSKIFFYEFDYDEWPGTHSNDTGGEPLSRPYTGSLFEIRKHYRTCFPEEEFEDIVNEDGMTKEGLATDKIYKIKYTINLLPIIGTHVDTDNGEKTIKNSDVSFCDDCANSDELDIFNAPSL